MLTIIIIINSITIVLQFSNNIFTILISNLKLVFGTKFVIDIEISYIDYTSINFNFLNDYHFLLR